MKRFFTCAFLLFAGLQGSSQTTYYWVGGTGPASFTSDNNWNTSLDGSGNSRAVAGSQYTDFLVFDGSNVGGTTATTGNVILNSGTDTVARMIFQNNVNVKFSRTGTGNSTISIQGDGTVLPDFVIGQGSVVTLGDLSNYNLRLLLGLPTVPTVATGSVSGTLYISPVSATSHTASYVSSITSNGLVFETGGECHVNDSTSMAPFNGSSINSVLFKSGSSLHYYGGRSPFGNSANIQVSNFEPGSNFYVKASNVSYVDGTAYASSSWVNQKSFANVVVQNGATFRADGPVFRMDDLTINAGSSFIVHSSGQTPVLGNLTVDGSLNFSSGNNGLVMGGEATQTISGAGTIDIPNFVVANSSDVVLSKTITVSSSTNIIGKINFGTNGRIAGAGSFVARVASTGTVTNGNATAGSYQLTGTIPTGINGYTVSGPGIAPNTNVVGFGASAGLIYLSKPALSSHAGASYSFGTDTVVLQTANANGFNPASGSVTSTGALTYQSGAKYIIDAATASPFGISSTATGSVTLGDLTINAPVTTNYNARLTGTLTLNSGILTIRATDTIRILNGYAVAGAPFNSSKYIVTARAGNEVGVFRMDGVEAASLLPVGTAANFLPASLTPSSASDFAVSVFEGVTLDGTTNGTAFNAEQRSSVVDAVWNINRVSGTGATNVQLSWTDPLEGTAFAAYPDVLIGVARHDGTQWENGGGSGNNTANTASNSYNDFSAFIVTRTGAVLPVLIHAVAASLRAGKATVSWNVSSETSIAKYEIEKSSDRIRFSSVGSVNAEQRNNYSFTDPANIIAVTYYRLKIISTSGEIKYSEIVVVKPGNNIAVNIFPNPASEFINVSGLKNNSIIRISAATGHLLMQQNTSAQFLNMNIVSLKPGTYVLEVFNDGKRTSSNTFVKQ